ncbi:MAG: hypothetical protein AB7Q42_21930 [Acidimicrobiia bacterium]
MTKVFMDDSHCGEKIGDSVVEVDSGAAQLGMPDDHELDVLLQLERVDRDGLDQVGSQTRRSEDEFHARCFFLSCVRQIIEAVHRMARIRCVIEELGRDALEAETSERIVRPGQGSRQGVPDRRRNQSFRCVVTTRDDLDEHTLLARSEIENAGGVTDDREIRVGRAHRTGEIDAGAVARSVTEIDVSEHD